MGRMVCRFFPFLICVILLEVFNSKASAGFVSPDALPEAQSLWPVGARRGDRGPAGDDSRSGFWNNVFYLGFLLFARDSEVSSGAPCQTGAGSFERPPIPQAGYLEDERSSTAELAAWLVRERRILMIHPYAGRLFRPPRDTAFRAM
jgi:hypothetical protein